MPVDPPTGYTDTSGQEPYNVWRCRCVEQPALMRGPSRIRNQARVGNGNYALLEPLRCAGCCWPPPDELGAASLSAPATAGAIALISGHALHLVVRLVLEKMPGRLPCPFIMRLGTFRSEVEQGLPIDG